MQPEHSAAPLSDDEFILAGYYRDETLTSELAKRVFVLPGRSEPGLQLRSA